LTTTWEEGAEKLAKLLLKNDRMLNEYIAALKRCTSFDNANLMARLLPVINHLNTQQIEDMIAAYNGSGELRGSFGFNGKNKVRYGPGLVSYLNKLGSGIFMYDAAGLIELA